MKAYQLIDTPEKWCRNSGSKDINGNPVPSLSAEACSFCVSGAIVKKHGSTWNLPSKEDHKKVQEALGLADSNMLVEWNDSPDRKWEDVYWLLKTLDI